MATSASVLGRPSRLAKSDARTEKTSSRTPGVMGRARPHRSLYAPAPRGGGPTAVAAAAARAGRDRRAAAARVEPGHAAGVARQSDRDRRVRKSGLVLA